MAECAEPEDAGRMKREAYRKKLAAVQPEMAGLREWLAAAGLRGIVLLEGLGPAGKGRTAQEIASGLGGKVAEAITLAPPNKRERGQWPFQRFVEHFPSTGQVVIFDGGWYHHAAMDRALGVRSEEELAGFLRACAAFEQTLAASGVVLFKYWFTADDEEQDRRFRAHVAELIKNKELKLPDPLPASTASVAEVLQTVLACTDHEPGHWHVIPANDRRRARLCCIEHLGAAMPRPEVEKSAEEV